MASAQLSELVGEGARARGPQSLRVGLSSVLSMLTLPEHPPGFLSPRVWGLPFLQPSWGRGGGR